MHDLLVESESPEERFWIEINWRPEFDSEVWAPRLGRGGGLTANHRLVPDVREGDVVVHHDSQAEQR